jgi:hypothetical protein
VRLDFNVLWVDDQPASVANQIKSITLKMAAEGFEFLPRQCTTLQEVQELVSDDVFTDEVDLILVDWDLGNGAHGEDAIERIREVVPYKDVVFYSGQSSVVELQQKAFEKKLEGVYCASREGLVDEVVGVFDSLIKKVLDLDHTRGIVMGATSDIDYMVNKCLALAHSKLDAEGKDKFISEALKRVTDKVNDIIKQSEKINSAPSIEALFEAHMLFTSDHRLRLLAKILEMDEFKTYSDGAIAIQSYREGVVRERNNLGHMVLVPNGKPNSVVNDANNVVDIEQMRELRKLILNLRADFRSLLEAMGA